MLINSDWHIHSEHSYDASNSLELIAKTATAQGLCRVGIADHLNLNDEKFIGDIHNSSKGVQAAQATYPFMVLGVELTPIERPLQVFQEAGKVVWYSHPFKNILQFVMIYTINGFPESMKQSRCFI